MYKLYSVTVNWTTGQPPYMPLVEGILGAHGDWLRLANGSWIAYSGDDAKALGAHVIAALPNETVLVVKLDADDIWGFAPNWVWSWVLERRPGVLPPGSFGPPTAPLLPYKAG